MIKLETALKRWVHSQLIHDKRELKLANDPELVAYYEGAIARLKKVREILNAEPRKAKTSGPS